MPLHVKQAISESLDIQSQLELRRCCRNFRDVIDTSATYYDSVTVEFFENRAKILAEGMTFYYETHQDGYMFKMNDKRGRRYRVVKGKGNFIDRALRFVESIFKHPKKSVERLEFGFVHKKTSIRRYQQIKDEFIDKMNQLMARTPYLLRVRIFALHMKLTEQDVLTFIRYCRPGTLKHIHLWHRITEPDTIPIDFLSEVAETEQWKRAKKFSQIDFPVSLPYEKWSHLQFHMCEVPTLTMHTLTSMIKNFLLTPDWIYFSVRHLQKNQELINYFQSLPLYKPGSKNRCIAIAGSESHVIKFEYQYSQVLLRKAGIGEKDYDGLLWDF